MLVTSGKKKTFRADGESLSRRFWPGDTFFRGETHFGTTPTGKDTVRLCARPAR